jgi:hypothetical protein
VLLRRDWQFQMVSQSSHGLGCAQSLLVHSFFIFTVPSTTGIWPSIGSSATLTE